MSSTTVVPKRERSPTPPLAIVPRTSGVKFISPLPAPCKRTSPTFRRARKKWVTEEIGKLHALGLAVTKTLVRDDGLSLDWESPVPVWPDTFMPANLPSSVAPTSSAARLQQGTSAQNESGPSRVVQVDQDFEKEAPELEDLAIEFLKKYVQTFDTDREALEGAYVNDALFSYSVHEHLGNIPRNSVAAAFTNTGTEVYRFTPRKGVRNLQQPKTSSNIHSGPSEIVSALRTLGPHKFCLRPPTNLHFDVVAVRIPATTKSTSKSVQEAKPRTLVFLSSYGDLAEERSDTEKRLSFDQCFLLQRPQHHDSISRGSATNRKFPRQKVQWPLVVVNHQLTIRDLSLRPLPI